MKIKTPKIEELFEAGVHIGHQAKRWHPKMEPYLYSVENKVHVFDLEQTHDLLKNASEFLFNTAKKGGQIIFVGTKRQASNVIKAMAKKSGALYVNERWLGGTITNYKTIKRNMDKLVTSVRQREAGELQKYTKKERLLIDREIEKLEKYVGGLVGLRGAPDVLVVIDPRQEKTAVREPLRWKVPVIALVDSNTDPSNVAYPIPGNDDAIKSISLIVNTLAEAVEEGYKEFAKVAASKASLDQKTTEEIVEKEPTPLIIKTDTKDEIATEKDLPKDVIPTGIAEVITAEPPVEKPAVAKGRPKKK